MISRLSARGADQPEVQRLRSPAGPAILSTARNFLPLKFSGLCSSWISRRRGLSPAAEAVLRIKSLQNMWRGGKGGGGVQTKQKLRPFLSFFCRAQSLLRLDLSVSACGQICQMLTRPCQASDTLFHIKSELLFRNCADSS